MITETSENGIKVFQLENRIIRVAIAPALGGKLSSIFNKSLKREFLWINKNIPFRAAKPGEEYDPNFIGGMDELIPNDIPENIDGVEYPDHGELWTTSLNTAIAGEQLTVKGNLPISKLYYEKTIRLHESEPQILLNYEIRNDSGVKKHFLWKLHAALQIENGDKLYTPAKYAQVVDANYSRFPNQLAPFEWPLIENTNASVVVPLSSNAMDFFYLFESLRGTMRLHYNDDKTIFACDYDQRIFPFQWWFASYGGFMGHYTAILEPCTNMPIMVKDAIAKNQCAVLHPGESIKTEVTIYAGDKNHYVS